jgi:hypothetical protein
MRSTRLISLTLLALLSFALTGCFLFAKSEAQAPPTEAEMEEPLAEEEAAVEGAAGGAMEGGGAADEMAPMPTAVAAAPEYEEAAEEAPGDRGGGEGFAEGAPAEVAPPQQRSPLQAGEIDDNADFETYLQYRRDYWGFSGAPVHDVDVSERHVISVRTSSGMPVLGAQVRVWDGETLAAEMRTTAAGTAYFFPMAYPGGANVPTFGVEVEKDGVSDTFTLERGNPAGAEWEVTLDVSPARPPVNLDVLFLIDSTGSMSDEIAQLQANILSISDKVSALPSRPDVRFGMVIYRDRGDEYITRVTDFTPDVHAFQEALRRVNAAGGDDYPESLNEALHDAVARPEWRVEDTVSLIFLVADAPPHLDYANDYDYAQEMVEAARLGIKIHPIASSGLDDQGEYVYRQIAQYTGGHFIFLTYEETPQESGEPGTTHHVEGYTVESLDDLVVQLIEDELANLSGQ